MRFWGVTATLLMCVMTAAAQGGRKPTPPSWQRSSLPPATPDLQTVVSRLEQAQIENRARMVPYAVTREYKLFEGAQQQPSSTVIAAVGFQPPDIKKWAIEQRSGSERGELVVRKVLEIEAESAREVKDVPFSRRNYDFRYLGIDELNHQRCYLLEISPKRKDKTLLRGRVWVDANSYRIRRFEGEPAKNPSWWVKNVELSLSYGDARGMWLQTEGRGVADVRLFGRYTMTESDLSYQTGTEVARNPPPAAHSIRVRAPLSSELPPSASAGSGLLANQ